MAGRRWVPTTEEQWFGTNLQPNIQAWKFGKRNYLLQEEVGRREELWFGFQTRTGQSEVEVVYS